MANKGKFNDLLDKLKIDEKYTKSVKKPKNFTKIKQNVPLVSDWNFMADLLFLPETKQGYKYCLVMTDLSNGDFDISPLKTKEPSEVLKGMKAMFKRKFIKEPYASIQTDAGNEFNGVFAKWMYDESIYHKVALPNRHSQMSNVESLNKQLGRLFNGYMNRMEEETGKTYKEWTDPIDIIRVELNKYRKKELPKHWVDYPYEDIDPTKKALFKEGDVVYRLLEAPHNSLGHAQSTKAFRMGDTRWDIKQPRKIVQVLPYAGDIPFRYMLEGIPNASFTEAQLKLTKDEKQSKYIVKKILDKKKEKNKLFYLIWWKGYLKKDATWESKASLIEDGLAETIKEFEQSLKDKKK